MKRILSLIILCSLISSCKKDDPPTPTPEPACEPTIISNHSYDTIFPSEYIMAYPGSWWKYDNGFTDSCDYWEVIPIHSTSEVNECLFVDEDMLVLPEKLNYHIGNIHFNKTVTTPENLESSQYTLLYDTLIGVFLERHEYGGEDEGAYTMDLTYETLERLDSLEIGGNTYYDVLHIKYTSDLYYYHNSGGPIFYTHRFFAKNIGLIKWTRDWSGGFIEEVQLLNHYIAPH